MSRKDTFGDNSGRNIWLIRAIWIPLHRVFHSIRFKVNKVLDSAESIFFALNPSTSAIAPLGDKGWRHAGESAPSKAHPEKPSSHPLTPSTSPILHRRPYAAARPNRRAPSLYPTDQPENHRAPRHPNGKPRNGKIELRNDYGKPRND